MFIKKDPEKLVIQTLKDIYDLGNVFYYMIYKTYPDVEVIYLIIYLAKI